MKLLCTSCQLLKEPRDEREAKSPLPFVCSDCRAKSSETKRARTSKPGVKGRAPSPELDFQDKEPAPPSADAPPSSEAEPVSLRDLEVMPGGESWDDAPPDPDPVSLRDLAVVVSPGLEPPRWSEPPPSPAPAAVEGTNGAPPARKPAFPRNLAKIARPAVATKKEPHTPTPTPVKAQPPRIATKPIVPRVEPRDVEPKKPAHVDEPMMPDSARAFAVPDEAPPAFRRAPSPVLRPDGLSPRPPDSSAADLMMMEALNPSERPAPKIAEPKAEKRDKAEPVETSDPIRVPVNDGTPTPLASASIVASAARAKPAPKPIDDAPPSEPMTESARPPVRREGEDSPSGILDIRQMVAQAEAAPNPARPGSFHEIDADLLNISGGLFADAPIAPVVALEPPDVSAPPAEAKKSIPLLAPPVLPKAPKSTPAAPPKKTQGAPSSAPVVAASSKAPPPPQGSRLPTIAAFVALGAVALYFAMKSREPLPPTPIATTSEATHATAAPTSTQAAPSQPATSRTEEPSVDDKPAASATASASAKTDAKAPVASTAAPKDTSTVAATKPPATSAPKDTSVVAVAPPPPKTADLPPATPPPSSGAEFDKAAAKAALAAAASRASACHKDGDPTGIAKLTITFAPSGRVTSPRVDGPPFQGTSTGGCIAQAFRGISVPPFDGSPVSVGFQVTIH